VWRGTRFPKQDTTRLVFKSERPVRLALKVRCPSWAKSGMTLSINGKKESVDATPGSYVTVERLWKNGDTVQVRLPMNLRMEAMPDDPKMVALLYGPIVLAGDLGKEGMQEVKRYGPEAPQVGRLKPIEVPAFVCDVKEVLAKVKPAQKAPLTFQTTGIGRPRDVLLLPFYKIAEPRYTVYWKVYSPAEWEKRKADLAAAQARRKQIERRTVDAVNINEQQSERDHNFQGEGALDGSFYGRRWRGARNGWFSYELKIAADKPVTLVCTYQGSEGRRRAFDVLVDGEKITTQTLESHAGEFFDVEYPLPETLTRGKQRISVKFRAQPDSFAGGVFDVRVVQ
jgi:uncharacterized protein